MANKEFDTLHRDMQQIIKALEQNNKIQSDRNRILRKYLESASSKQPYEDVENTESCDFIDENIRYVNQVASNHEKGFVIGDPVKRESI